MNCCGKLIFRLTILLAVSVICGFPVFSGELAEENIVHTVRSSDTIEKISYRYKVPEDRLRRANKITESISLKPGQKIEVPREKIIPKRLESGLIINLPEYTVYQFDNGQMLNMYTIAIGKKNWQTPRGEFTVANKTVSPTWKIPPRMAETYEMERELIPPGPDNPLGEYWVGLSLPHIGIHSTNNPKSVGLPISHGCMRMYPDDAENFFNSVNIGLQGEIIYEPVKIATRDGYVYLEIHEDIYGMYSDLYEHTVNSLKELGVHDYTDDGKIMSVIEKKSGVPVNISLSRVIGLDINPNKKGTKKLWNKLDVKITNLPNNPGNL